MTFVCDNKGKGMLCEVKWRGGGAPHCYVPGDWCTKCDYLQYCVVVGCCMQWLEKSNKLTKYLLTVKKIHGAVNYFWDTFCYQTSEV